MGLERVVAIVAEVGWGKPARTIFENLPSKYEARVHPYGGTRRRFYVTIDSADAASAATDAAAVVKGALGDFLDANAEFYVDEVVLKVPIDPSWERL